MRASNSKFSCSKDDMTKDEWITRCIARLRKVLRTNDGCEYIAGVYYRGMRYDFPGDPESAVDKTLRVIGEQSIDCHTRPACE